MFQHSQKKSRLQAILWIAELLYHATVREVRSSHGNAVIGMMIEFATRRSVSISWSAKN